MRMSEDRLTLACKETDEYPTNTTSVYFKKKRNYVFRLVLSRPEVEHDCVETEDG